MVPLIAENSRIRYRIPHLYSSSSFDCAYNRIMSRKPRPDHSPEEFGLDVLSGDADLFRWFLLCYLFGKPIRSEQAVETWRLLIKNGLDNPWAIRDASEHSLVRVLHTGGYTRYQHVTAAGLHQCMEKLIRLYDGSLLLMLEGSPDEDEFAKLLQGLHGIGPKVAGIFIRGIDEYFARRVE